MAPKLIDPAPDFGDPLGLLAACHSRIEAQCATLLRLPGHLTANGCDPQARQAAEKVLRYFTSAGPHHHEDEEQDLFPLLKSTARAEGATDILALLGTLKAEHRDMEAAWAALSPFLQRLAQGERVEPGRLPVDPFVALYRSHMAREDVVLLPYAHRALSPGQLESLGRGMARRRHVDTGTL